jgi:hypothetical protein
MVMNSFRNKNFMQPMGRLSMHSWWTLVFSLWGEFFLFFFLDQSLPPAISLGQKCWQIVLEIKNTCSQWVGRSMHLRCLDFFLLNFGWKGWGEDFFHFSFVPSMFPSSAQWVLKFPMCSPKVFQVHLALIPYILPKVLPFSPICQGQRGKHFIFQ